MSNSTIYYIDIHTKRLNIIIEQGDTVYGFDQVGLVLEFIDIYFRYINLFIGYGL